MSLNTIEILLGVESDVRVATLFERYSDLLLARLQRSNPDIGDIPEELEYIVDELTISRFNRIGSEGMISETMDGHSANYGDISAETSLTAYEDVINAYLSPESENTWGTVRFL
ncbi:MAG: phage head-tail connector protein [Fastidiosipila sp.]|nr:phage head-tail connector protein [Fastidiosipila sp.]